MSGRLGSFSPHHSLPSGHPGNGISKNHSTPPWPSKVTLPLFLWAKGMSRDSFNRGQNRSNKKETENRFAQKAKGRLTLPLWFDRLSSTGCRMSLDLYLLFHYYRPNLSISGNKFVIKINIFPKYLRWDKRLVFFFNILGKKKDSKKLPLEKYEACARSPEVCLERQEL